MSREAASAATRAPVTEPTSAPPSPVRAAALPTVSTVDALESTLTARMLAGDYESGDRMRESALAAEYGVSRHTLRAALARLSSAGVLDFDANRGWSVLTLSERDFQDITFVRLGLEVQAARALAAAGGGIGPGAQAALDEIAGTVPKESWPSRLDKDMRFHLALVDAVGSPRLSQLYRNVQLSLHLYLTQRPDWFASQSLAEWKAVHVHIAATIASGDVDLVDRSVRDSLSYALPTDRESDPLPRIVRTA